VVYPNLALTDGENDEDDYYDDKANNTIFFTDELVQHPNGQ
jgi:hypothetical protein